LLSNILLALGYNFLYISGYQNIERFLAIKKLLIFFIFNFELWMNNWYFCDSKFKTRGDSL